MQELQRQLQTAEEEKKKLKGEVDRQKILAGNWWRHMNEFQDRYHKSAMHIENLDNFIKENTNRSPPPFPE